jgi:hypothetical protein
VLLELAGQVGLDAERAREVLDQRRLRRRGARGRAVLAAAGIRSVPAVVINQRHLISGRPAARGLRAGAAADRRRGARAHGLSGDVPRNIEIKAASTASRRCCRAPARWPAARPQC